MEGTAFDIAMPNHDPAAFEAAAREAGFLGFGFYPLSDDSLPRPTAFAVETPPAREVVARAER